MAFKQFWCWHLHAFDVRCLNSSSWVFKHSSSWMVPISHLNDSCQLFKWFAKKLKCLIQPFKQHSTVFKHLLNAIHILFWMHLPKCFHGGSYTCTRVVRWETSFIKPFLTFSSISSNSCPIWMTTPFPLKKTTKHHVIYLSQNKICFLAN